MIRLVTLEVGESVTLTGFYVIEEAAFNTGSVVNSIVATGDSPSGTDDVVASSGDTVTSLSHAIDYRNQNGITRLRHL